MYDIERILRLFPDADIEGSQDLLFEFAQCIDQTFLDPSKGENQFMSWLSKSMIHSFKALCISPFLVPLAVEELADTDTDVATVIAFPLGNQSRVTTALQAHELVKRGATDLEMVMNVGQFKEGHRSYVFDSIVSAQQAAQQAAEELAEEYELSTVPHITFKVIIETAYLSPEEICEATDLVSSCPIDFIKTSSGFSPRGATADDVRLIASCIEPGVGIKASGGIRTLDDACTLLEAGASRLGTSHGIELMEQLAELCEAQGYR